MRTRTLLLTLLAAATATAGWMYAAAAPATVSTAAAGSPQSSPGFRVVRGRGYVEPANELRRLAFRTNGVIARSHVSIGQAVAQGETLMELDHALEQTAVDVASQELQVALADRDQLLAGAHRAEIAAAEQRLKLAEERAQYAHKSLKRTSALIPQKAATQADLDRAETDDRQSAIAVREAQAELYRLQNKVRTQDRAMAEAKVSLAQAQLAAAKERLTQTCLVAPFAGVVLEILKREGEGTMDLEPVIVFADVTNLRVRAEIDERYVSQLQRGQQTLVHGPGLGPQKLPGQIAVIKQLMGKKTVFTHDASERKDLDVLQVLIEMAPDFSAPLGLQVDVDIEVQDSLD
jgi:multidrug resistance efflux pump